MYRVQPKEEVIIGIRAHQVCETSGSRILVIPSSNGITQLNNWMNNWWKTRKGDEKT
jgi:hypothetical protein